MIDDWRNKLAVADSVYESLYPEKIKSNDPRKNSNQSYPKNEKIQKINTAKFLPLNKTDFSFKPYKYFLFSFSFSFSFPLFLA